MSHFFAGLLLFWLKALGLIAFIVIGLVFLIAMIAKVKGKNQKGLLTIENISADFESERQALEAETLDKKALKALRKERKAAEKARRGATEKRLFVLEFKGDLKAEEAENLAESVTALLQIATEQDQVLLKLESAGGVVQGYGFAAAQLARIRDKSLKLTIAVDQVAASGGYLMAAVAHEIIASPFAIIGSIGVVAQIPNFHRLLTEKGVDFEQVTAGEYKRTLTLFGKNTKAEREKLKEQLEAIHHQFKTFIQEYRPQINLAEVATGEYWLAKHALELHLVDRLQVSDDFILSAYQQDHKIYRIRYLRKKSVGGKLGRLFSSMQFCLDLLTHNSHIRTTL